MPKQHSSYHLQCWVVFFLKVSHSKVVQNFIFSCPGWNTLKKYFFFFKYIDINILDLFSKIVSCTCFQMLTGHVKNAKVDSQLLVNILIAWSFPFCSL